MAPPSEQNLFQLSYLILPRGCKKSEKEIEKEANERDTELNLTVSLGSTFLLYTSIKSTNTYFFSIKGDERGSEKKDFKFNIHQTVKYCKDKICSRISCSSPRDLIYFLD